LERTLVKERHVRLGVFVIAIVLAMAGTAVARTPGSIRECLAKEGAITKLNGPTEIDAWWHTTFVEVFAVKNRAFAQAIVDGGERYGKPPASYLIHGTTVASFWEVPTKAMRTRVAACI
jgi:hypothetical protein